MSDPVRILLVDDESVDRENVRRALIRSDVNALVVEATDVASGLSQLTEETFDCALVDYRLPDGDAWDFLDARDIKDQVSGETYREPPIVILTGYGSEVVAVEFLRAGACDYVSKSEITPSRLGQAVRNALRFAQMNRRTRQALRNLRDSEAGCDYLFDLSSEALVITDLQGSMLKVSSSACQILGNSEENLLGKGILQMLPPDQMADVRACFERREETSAPRSESQESSPGHLEHVRLSSMRVTHGGEPAVLLHLAPPDSPVDESGTPEGGK